MTLPKLGGSKRPLLSGCVRSTIPTEEFCRFAEALGGGEVEVDCTTTSGLLSVFFLGNMRKIATPSDFYMVLVFLCCTIIQMNYRRCFIFVPPFGRRFASAPGCGAMDVLDDSLGLLTSSLTPVLSLVLPWHHEAKDLMSASGTRSDTARMLSSICQAPLTSELPGGGFWRVLESKSLRGAELASAKLSCL